MMEVKGAPMESHIILEFFKKVHSWCRIWPALKGTPSEGGSEDVGKEGVLRE